MLSVLDLFSGCGGLSLGAHQAGFKTAAAIDADPILSSSFSINFPHAKLLNADVRDVDGTAIRTLLPDGVDGVVGGPPCQPFSEMGRRDVEDPRRNLVAEYFRIVNLVQPKFFVFENVRGLAFDANISLLHAGLSLLPPRWVVSGPHILNAADFGAPTRRLRMFVFGFNKNECSPPSQEALLVKLGKPPSVRDAIADLMTASEAGVDNQGFDSWRYDGRRTVSDYARGLRSTEKIFTGHRKTAHTQETILRFEQLAQGGIDKIGKYVRLSWNGLCPTLRAGTGSDKGSYQAVRPVHPSLDRVITPREAARLQGFPDNFIFHPTTWHSCRMIGNSVSPPLARTVMSRIASALQIGSPGRIHLAAE